MVFWGAVTEMPDRGAVFCGAVTDTPDRGAVFCAAVTGVPPTGAVRLDESTERPMGAVRPAEATVIFCPPLQ